jgi:hypothetical protein
MRAHPDATIAELTVDDRILGEATETAVEIQTVLDLLYVVAEASTAIAVVMIDIVMAVADALAPLVAATEAAVVVHVVGDERPDGVAAGATVAVACAPAGYFQQRAGAVLAHHASADALPPEQTLVLEPLEDLMTERAEEEAHSKQAQHSFAR